MLGARAAREEANARERMKGAETARDIPRYEASADPHFRLEVLRLAQTAPGAGTLPDEVVARAATYLTFTKGDTSV